MEIPSYLLYWIKQNGGAQPTPPNLEEKSVTITENGTTNVTPDTGYDGLSSVAITTNVQAPSEYNAKSSTEISYVVGQIRAEKALQLVEELPAELTIASGAIFRSIMQSFFEGMTALKSLPYIDTTGQTNFYHLANSCPLLENVPAYNTASITNVNGLNGMFTNCNKLTNESLNNIMQMCINAINYPGTKTLKFVGLTQAQATTCQSLSNWDAFVAAGWSTGY